MKETPHQSTIYTKRVWKKDATTGDLYGPAMNIHTEEDATEYMAALTRWSVLHHGQDLKVAWDTHLKNIGYFAGYFDEKTQKRVEKVFKTKHPIFGSASLGVIRPEAAFEAGVAAAKGGTAAARKVIAMEKARNRSK